MSTFCMAPYNCHHAGERTDDAGQPRVNTLNMIPLSPNGSHLIYICSSESIIKLCVAVFDGSGDIMFRFRNLITQFRCFGELLQLYGVV